VSRDLRREPTAVWAVAFNHEPRVVEPEPLVAALRD